MESKCLQTIFFCIEMLRGECVFPIACSISVKLIHLQESTQSVNKTAGMRVSFCESFLICARTELHTCELETML